MKEFSASAISIDVLQTVNSYCTRPMLNSRSTSRPE